jgi:hypothetical protein
MLILVPNAMKNVRTNKFLEQKGEKGVQAVINIWDDVGLKRFNESRAGAGCARL